MRPIIEFKFEIILTRSNNIFELQTVENIDVLIKVIFFILFIVVIRKIRSIKCILITKLYNLSQKIQGGGGGGDDGAGDNDLEENLMAEEVDNTLHFKGFIIKIIA